MPAQTIPNPNTYTVTLLDGEEKTVEAHSFITGDGYHTFSVYVDTPNGVTVEAVFRVACSLVKYVEARIPRPSGLAPLAPIESLDLWVRAYNVLKRNGIVTVGDLLRAVVSGDVLLYNGFGDAAKESTVNALVEAGYIRADKKDG